MAAPRRQGLWSRRDIGLMALAAMSLGQATSGMRPKAAGSTIRGVRIGVQSFSFRSLPDGAAIVKAMAQIGLESVELMSNHAEGMAGAPRDAAGLRAWREKIQPDAFTAVRRTFEAAGIAVDFLCYNLEPGVADGEIDYAFRMARALGVRAITTSTQVRMAKRIAPLADKHRMMVGFHNHHHSSTADPEDIVTPESFATCLAASKFHGINLDVGHFTAANFDAVAFLEKNHQRVTNIHLKDRKRDQGAIVPWGTGDAPLKEVLRLLRDRKYPFPANIEYEYRGSDAVAEVGKCYQFCREALTS